MPGMHETLEEFCDSLRMAEAALDRERRLVLRQERAVFDRLADAERRLRSIAGEGAGDGAGNGDGNAPASGAEAPPEEDGIPILRREMAEMLSAWASGMARWRGEREETSRVREELENYGSRLIVAVFGRTNSGKSALGNFIRGRELRAAPFDNPWRRGFLPGPVAVIERGAGSVESSGEEWFREGVTETTREAQLFTLPGLLWLDTPGFGSARPELGDLARKYVSRADVVVCLDHSDNPGLGSGAAEIRSILENGRLALLIINASDRLEIVREHGDIALDADGAPIRRPVPKDARVREDQEIQLRTALRARGFTGRCEVSSLSVILAAEAVRTDDDALFAASGMPRVLEGIRGLIPDEDAVRRLKHRVGRRLLVDLIDAILGDGPAARDSARADGDDLPGLRRRLRAMEKSLERMRAAFDVTRMRREAERAIRLKAMPLIDEIVSGLARKAEARKIMEKYGMSEAPAPAETPPPAPESGRGGFLGALRELFGAGPEEKPAAAPPPKEEEPEDIFGLSELNALVADACRAEIRLRAERVLEGIREDLVENLRFAFPALKLKSLEGRVELEYRAPIQEACIREPETLAERIGSIFGRKCVGTRTRFVLRRRMLAEGFNAREIHFLFEQNVDETVRRNIGAALESIRRDCLEDGAARLREMAGVLDGTERELRAIRGDLLAEMERQ